MTISSGFHLSDLQYWRELKILAERASRDVLSGLLNRETATDYIEQCLRHMHPGDTCALFIIDLDNFKQVNDTLGHQAGDQVIRLAAKALSGCFRATDIVGRLGGDEFFALLAGPITEDTAREKARCICEALQFSIGVNPTLHVSSSVGVYIASGETRAFEKLYERADAALYEAKAEGRNRYHVSSGDDSVAVRREADLTSQVPVQMRAVLDHMEEGVALLEVKDSISVVYASPSLLRMLNLESGSVSLPCDFLLLSGIHPDDMPEYERRLREGLAGGRVVEYEHRFDAKGKWRWCRARVVRMSASGGEGVMLALVRDITGARQSEDRLFQGRELLKLALDRGSRILWEVDVESRRFRLFNCRRNLSSVTMENFPESLIEKNWVHPDSVDRFRAFAQALLGGRPAGGGAFILRHKMSRGFGWFSLYYRILPDGDRRPLKVIGLAEPLGGGLSGEGSGRERLWESLRPNLFCYLRLNLTKDCVEALWAEGRTFTQHLRGVSCMELTQWEQKRLFRQEDRDEFLSVFGRSALLEAFAEGREWLTREYRRVDVGGEVRWLSYTAHLAKNPLTGDVQAFGFLQDSERRHEREAALAESLRDLPVQGIYSREMARKLAESVLENGGFPLHMLALIRVFGLFGPEAGRRRSFITMAFSLLLGSDCVIGERGEDAFTVFRSDAAPRAVTRQRLDEAFAFVRQALFDCGMAVIPRFVAAVTCCDLGGIDYEELLGRAEKVCAEWENAPSDAIVFIDDPSPVQADPLRSAEPENEEPSPAAPASGQTGGGENAAPPQKGAPRKEENPAGAAALSEVEKNVALDCMEALLLDDSLDVVMAGVLRRLGEHYRADRVYTLALAEDGRTVRATHEWVAEGQESLKKELADMPLDKLPLCWRCLRENAPQFMRRLPKGRGWVLFPLAPAAGGPDGILCVENPQADMRKDRLLPRLLPHVEKVLRLGGVSGPGHGSAMRDTLTGLQNLRAYMDRVCTLTSDSYSSMGAFILDIPGTASGDGRTADSRQRSWRVIYLAEMLRAVFGRELLFRTRSNEFVALCANTTQNVFLARVLRAQSMLQSRYPGQLRFGYTWSEGLFSGDKLVKEARTIMLCGQLEAPAGGEAHPELGMRGPGMAGTGGLESFTIYLQPKVDLRDGSLVGAEALVRGLDGTGHVIEPSRFVEAMERTGVIRELDLHVVNMTLSAMEKWRVRGWKTVPVSVNFSRATLLSVSAPGAVLSLFSRYPQLSPGLLEVEVSENAGDLEDRTLERAMAGFRPFGMRFGLDDFGTRYANLSVFANVAFDTVKLDRSLIRSLTHNPVGRTLVGDIVRLCAARNMTCVAEGVENQAQIDALLEEGCLFGQGFYYGRPMSVPEFERRYLRPAEDSEGENS